MGIIELITRLIGFVVLLSVLLGYLWFYLFVNRKINKKLKNPFLKFFLFAGWGLFIFIFFPVGCTKLLVINQLPSKPPIPVTAPVAPPTQTSSISLKASDFGDEWPFTVDGELDCLPVSETTGSVILRSGERIYGINGIAQNSGNFAPIESIWKDNPQIPGAKMNIGDVIDRGLKICDQK